MTAWYRRKSTWIAIAATVASVIGIVELSLLATGNRVLTSQDVIHPSKPFVVNGTGYLPSDKAGLLVCDYFSGRSVSPVLFVYSSIAASGRDECPLFYKPAVTRDDVVIEGGALADWISGIGSLLAVIAALYGYFLVEKQRRADEREKIQGHIYQIGFKLATFASEARTTMRDLNQKNLPLDELLAEAEPLIVIGSQAEVLGYERTMVRPLSDAEENFLMLLREEEFLMDFSECVARNESVRGSMVEYVARRQDLLARLPSAERFSGQTGSFGLTPKEYNDLLPYLTPATALIRQARYLGDLNVKMIAKLSDDFMPMMKRHYPNMHVHQIVLQELPPGSGQGL